ncbi:hypothetical protein ACLOJK_039025, partial [Asimina triloba]
DEFFKFIELPSTDNTIYLEESCIWEFEGRLHYCRVDGCVVEIWELQMEEKNYIPSQQCFKWQHVHSGVLSRLKSIHRHYRVPTFSPFAFNEDFGILYMKYEDGNVISYNPETKKQELAYKCPRQKVEMTKFFRHVGFPFL